MALHFASKRGHIDVVKLLIQNGVDVGAVIEEEQLLCTWHLLN